MAVTSTVRSAVCDSSFHECKLTIEDYLVDTADDTTHYEDQDCG